MPIASRMKTRGTATPIPILASEERPLDPCVWVCDEAGLLEFVGEGFADEVEVDVGLGEPPLVIAITFVMAADFLSVNVDVYSACPEGMVVVT